jgi:hypothetical protein
LSRPNTTPSVRLVLTVTAVIEQSGADPLASPLATQSSLNTQGGPNGPHLVSGLVGPNAPGNAVRIPVHLRRPISGARESVATGRSRRTHSSRKALSHRGPSRRSSEKWTSR